MKSINNIIIGFCTLLAFASKAQNPLFFDKYYSIGYTNSYNNNVLLLQDSTFLFSSYTADSATSRLDYGLFKLDRYGNLLQKNIINYFNLGYYRPGTSYNNIINISNSSLMAVGTTFINSHYVVVFSKINKNTIDTIKTCLFSDSINFYGIGNLLQVHPNKYLAIGNKANISSGLQWPVIFELDSNINITSVVQCNNPNNFVTFFANYFSNKKIIIAGSTQIATINYPFIAEIDTLGNIINFKINSESYNGISQVFYNNYDNTYFTIGGKVTSSYGNNGMFRICVTKYSANLNLLWQKTYAKANYTTNVYDAVVNNDGSMVVVGRYSDSVYLPVKNVNTNAVMLKINANGDSLWMREFDHINNTTSWNNTYLEVFFGIEKTPEGGYIMCGNAQQQPKTQAWVVKTDSMGCVLSNCSTTNINELNATIKELNVYPNPATNILNIEYNLLGETIKDIKLINSLGNTVLTTFEFVDKKMAIMDINNLMSGVYSISITNQNNTIITKKIVVIK